MDNSLNDLTISLVSAVIAAIAAGVFRLSRKKAQRRSAKRRFPIHGIYASSYTDEINGELLTVRDEVRIDQQGLNFTGISRNLANGRKFRVEGRIVDDYYLTGTYYGEHRADAASGVFFMSLELHDLSSIRGLWAGFGAEQGSIMSGEWNWRSVANVLISESRPAHKSRPLAASILNDALGPDYVKVEELDELAASAEGTVLLAGDEHDRDKVVGVATALVMSEADKTDLAGKLAAAGVRRVNLTGAKVGLLKSVAVVPNGRRRGVGLKMVHAQLKRLKEMGCLSVFTLSWDSGDKDSSLGMLEAAGFQRVAVLPEYWREPPGQETFECIKCGIPCVCSAIVLRRSLYDLDTHFQPRLA